MNLKDLIDFYLSDENISWESEIWIETGRNTSGEALNIERLNKDDILLSTNRFREQSAGLGGEHCDD